MEGSRTSGVILTESSDILLDIHRMDSGETLDLLNLLSLRMDKSLLLPMGSLGFFIEQWFMFLRTLY